jgi:hypothetical protein
VHRQLGRDPAAQRPADHVDAFQAEAVEDVEVVVHEIVDRLDLGHVVGAAEPGVVGGDDLEAARQEAVEGEPGSRASRRVQEQQWRPIAAAQDLDRAGSRLEPLVGALDGRSGRRVGHNCILLLPGGRLVRQSIDGRVRGE